ncbi:UNVERIFIED_CONTAM: hypothetical protein K2H54_061844 [Gekko kuhli]
MVPSCYLLLKEWFGKLQECLKIEYIQKRREEKANVGYPLLIFANKYNLELNKSDCFSSDSHSSSLFGCIRFVEIISCNPSYFYVIFPMGCYYVGIVLNFNI